MRLYDCTADCLVDNVLLHHYVKARNERDAWLQGYVYFNYHCEVADGGTVDCKRLTQKQINDLMKSIPDSFSPVTIERTVLNMKSSEFKSFISILENASSNNPIWHAGYAFMRLTPRQHEKVWETLNARGFKHVPVNNLFGSFDGIELPTGLVLLKGGNGERW